MPSARIFATDSRTPAVGTTRSSEPCRLSKASAPRLAAPAVNGPRPAGVGLQGAVSQYY